MKGPSQRLDFVQFFSQIRFSFRVVGGRSHDVRVYDGQFNYPKTIFFERGGTKIINVEPGTAVYI